MSKHEQKFAWLPTATAHKICSQCETFQLTYYINADEINPLKKSGKNRKSTKSITFIVKTPLFQI